jgi:hypothetical protein
MLLKTRLLAIACQPDGLAGDDGKVALEKDVECFVVPCLDTIAEPAVFLICLLSPYP